MIGRGRHKSALLMTYIFFPLFLFVCVFSFASFALWGEEHPLTTKEVKRGSIGGRAFRRGYLLMELDLELNTGYLSHD